MDRLAFRIWDPENKTFHHSGSTPTMLAGYFDRTKLLVTVHGMKHEQFIRLNDVDEKPIYDGDIVEYEDYYAPGEELFINCGEIVVDEESFTVTNRETNTEMLCDMVLKIVGDKHLNPYLLMEG